MSERKLHSCSTHIANNENAPATTKTIESRPSSIHNIPSGKRNAKANPSQAYGCFPNSLLLPNGTCDPEHIDYYAQSSFGGDGAAIVAMGATNSDNASEYYLAMAATPAWAQYDKLQCQIFFEPMWFDVSVSVLETSIVVTPGGDGPDAEPRGMLRSKVLDALNVCTVLNIKSYR